MTPAKRGGRRPGAGRKPSPNKMFHLGFRVDGPTKKILYSVAENHGKRISEYVRDCVVAALLVDSSVADLIQKQL